MTATGIGGNAWDAPGHIWYESLLASNPSTDFQAFADTTYYIAGSLYGDGSQEQQSVRAAWSEVGIYISGAAVAKAEVKPPALKALADSDALAVLHKRIDALAEQVKGLSK